MNSQDFTTSFQVGKPPETVFRTVTNVRNWWSGLFGEEIEDEPEGGFTFRAGGGVHYSRQMPVAVEPGRKVMWLVTDSRLSFASDQHEWTGTRFGFELLPEGEGTNVTFTHSGLTPQLECFEQCSAAWSRYLAERLVPLLDSRVSAGGISPINVHP